MFDKPANYGMLRIAQQFTCAKANDLAGEVNALVDDLQTREAERLEMKDQALSNLVNHSAGELRTICQAHEDMVFQLTLDALRVIDKRRDVLQGVPNKVGVPTGGIISALTKQRERCEKELEAKRKEAAKSIRSSGLDPTQDPRLASNRDAAQIQLDHLITRSLPVREAKTKLDDANNQVVIAQEQLKKCDSLKAKAMQDLRDAGRRLLGLPRPKEPHEPIRSVPLSV